MCIGCQLCALSLSLRTRCRAHISSEVLLLLAKVGVTPFGLADNSKFYSTVHNGTPRVLIHILEEVFVISWDFILRRCIHFKDVYQAGGITPTVATLVVALSSHSVSSHPN